LSNGNNGRRLSLAERAATVEPTEWVRALIYGPEGIGKTTAACEAEDPVFLLSDKGLHRKKGAKYFVPENWEEVMSLTRELATEDHPYKTLVYDVANGFHPKVVDYVCRRDNSGYHGKLIKEGRPNLEGYGFGRGPDVAAEEWRLLLALVEKVWERGMHVIFLAHAEVCKEKNLEGNDYGVIAPSLPRQVRELIMQHVDMTMYAAYQKRTIDAVYGDERAKRAKIVSTGERVLRVVNEGPHRAKTRYTMPSEIPLSWNVFMSYVRAEDLDGAEAARREIVALTRRLRNPPREREIYAWTTSASNDVDALTTFLGALREEVAGLVSLRDALLAEVAARVPGKLAATRAWTETVGLNVDRLNEAYARITGAAPAAAAPPAPPAPSPPASADAG